MEELKEELLHIEEHVTGLEQELSKAQQQCLRQSGELAMARDQALQLEQQLGEREDREARGLKKSLGRCKTDGLTDVDSAKARKVKS